MRKLAPVVLAALFTIAACGESGSDRPELVSWEPQWSSLSNLIPDSSAVDEGGVEVCSKFLGDVRERRNKVIPTPDLSLEEPVTEWVAEAETIGLDCDREGDLVERLTDLHDRAEAIETLIDQLPG